MTTNAQTKAYRYCKEDNRLAYKLINNHKFEMLPENIDVQNERKHFMNGDTEVNLAACDARQWVADKLVPTWVTKLSVEGGTGTILSK